MWWTTHTYIWEEQKKQKTKWYEMKQDWILQAKQYISTDIRIMLTSTEYQN